MNKFSTLKINWIFPAVLLAAIALTLVACSGAKGSTVVNASLSEYKIELDKTSFPAGPVKFVIKNTGTMAHAFVLEPAGAKDEPFELNGKKSEMTDIQPGQTVTLDWTIDSAGDYQISCYTPGHFEQGMTTTFTATAP